MGVIKTALEIALEKTESVKSDKAGIDQFEARQKGKKIANAFLAGEIDLAEELKKEGTASGCQESLKQGIFDVLTSRIAIPLNEEDERLIATVGSGLAAVINNKEFPIMYGQFTQLMSRYLQEASQYEQAIRKQYAPKLRQKEEELSRRLGSQVRIDPLQDPEFAAFLSQNMNALRNNYEPIVKQAKEEARRMFEAG